MESFYDKMWGWGIALIAGLLSFVRWQYVKMDNKLDAVIEDHNRTKIDMATSKTLIKALSDNIEDLKESVTTQNEEIKQLLISFAQNQGNNNTTTNNNYGKRRR